MATTIVTKSGSGAPAASDLVAGELAVDLTNKRLYTEDSSAAIIELGTNPSGNVTFGDNGKAIFGAGSDLQIYHDASHSYISEQGTGNLRIYANDLVLANNDGSQTFLYGQNGGPVSLSYANNAKLATTSTGIDVTGTATADGLTVAGNISSTQGGTAAAPKFTLSGSTTTGLFTPATDALGVSTAGAERMRIDSAGNVGIGAVPEAWTLFDVLQIGDGGSIASVNASSKTTRLGSNLYYDGAWKRMATGTATSYVQYNGDHIWNSTASGTADVGFTETERMRIDSSGNVGIGTSSPGRLLTVRASGAQISLLSDTTGSSVVNLGDTDDDNIGRIQYNNSTDEMSFRTNTADRMTIDSAGNLLLGKTSSANAQTTAGHLLLPDGRHYATASGGPSGIFSRTTSDGDILSFYQGSTPTLVGSVGANSDGLYISSPYGTDSGIRFASSLIAPSTTTGANRDAAIDLGYSSSRFRDLHLSRRVHTGDGIQDAGSAGSESVFNNGQTTANFRVASTGSANTLFVDGGTNNVGIGTNNPSFATGSGLEIQRTTATATLRLEYTGSNALELSAEVGQNTYNAVSSLPHVFEIGSVEKMRLDPSGNLLVGKTTTAFNTKGMQIDGSNGNFSITATGATTAFFNRTSTDGTIAEFYKDGTTVGSIGTGNSGNLHIGSGDTGINFNADINSVYPINPTSGASSNGTIDLGYGGIAFKDLHLSGGAYLGGTTAANKLDDYEEGSWTPTYTNIGTGNYNVRVGRYTKIGDQVFAQFHLTVNPVGTASGQLIISGLPFTATSDSANYGSQTTPHASGWTNNLVNLGGLVSPSATESRCYYQNSVGDMTAATHALMGNGNFLATIIYKTA
jgi:hypothetical protein